MQKTPFFIVAGSYYVKTHKDVIVPAEVSLIRWTLEDGITDQYTNVVDGKSLTNQI